MIIVKRLRVREGCLSGVGDIDNLDVQCARIDSQVHLAPLAPVFGSVLLALPFAFA